MVEVDEAKFGKHKFNKGGYRKGMWVLGEVDRETGQCLLVLCPGNARSLNAKSCLGASCMQMNEAPS